MRSFIFILPFKKGIRPHETAESLLLYLRLLPECRMLYAIMQLCLLCIVPAIYSPYEIACYAAYTFELRTVFFRAMAVRAFVIDDASVSTYGVAVYRVIDGTVAYAVVMHAAYNRFKCRRAFDRSLQSGH